MIQTGRVAQNDAMYAYRFVELKKKQITELRKSVAAAKIAYENMKKNIFKVLLQLHSTLYY